MKICRRFLAVNLLKKKMFGSIPMKEKYLYRYWHLKNAFIYSKWNSQSKYKSVINRANQWREQNKNKKVKIVDVIYETKNPA